MEDKLSVYNKKLNKALIKRALGYLNKEVTEEFSNEEDKLVLTKRKVTKKNVPPDIAAVKYLLEIYGEKDDYSNYSDEELLLERDKLLEKLRKNEND